jgi:DNA-binding HxlR family transcriptional regulator
LVANSSKGSVYGARAGAQTLLLLSTPLNFPILKACEEGTKQQTELRREAGFPAQTTLRAQLKVLMEIGALEQHRRNRFPGVLDYELTAAGRDLLAVAFTLEHWLESFPDGPLPLGSHAAKRAIKALAEGWSTTMLRALAAGPLSLTELNRVIIDLSYPALERRLTAMRLANLVEAQPGEGRSTPYAVTAWLRHALAPLIAAIDWEQRYLFEQAPPVTRMDTEDAFLLALPLLRPTAIPSGTCRLAVEIADDGGVGLAGVMVQLTSGRIASCATEIAGQPDASALGPPKAWVKAVVERDVHGLEMSGNRKLARTLIIGLHAALFGPAIG